MNKEGNTSNLGGHFDLMSLPREVRDQIYSYMVITQRDLDDLSGQTSDWFNSAVLLANHQIRSEAFSILHDQEITIRAKLFSHNFKFTEGCMAKSRLRKYVLEFDIRDGPFYHMNDNRYLAADIGLSSLSTEVGWAPKLQSLCIHVLSSTLSAQPQGVNKWLEKLLLWKIMDDFMYPQRLDSLTVLGWLGVEEIRQKARDMNGQRHLGEFLSDDLCHRYMYLIDSNFTQSHPGQTKLCLIPMVRRMSTVANVQTGRFDFSVEARYPQDAKRIAEGELDQRCLPDLRGYGLSWQV